MRNLRNKKNDFLKIFITGAGSGIGKLSAIALARRGYEVFAGVKFEKEKEFFEKIIIQKQLKIHVFICNILNENDRKMISELGVDILVCNAAIGDSGSIAEISVYCATKSALDCFGICLRQEMKLLNKLDKTNIEVCLVEPGAYATGFNAQNNAKKYEWMYTHSYFAKYAEKIRAFEKKMWSFLEQKKLDSAVKLYVKAVTAKHPKARYSCPWWQAMLVQIGRIFGL